MNHPTPLDMPKRKPVQRNFTPHEHVVVAEVSIERAEELMRNRWGKATVHIRYGRSHRARNAPESDIWRAWVIAPSAKHGPTIHVVTVESVCHVFGMMGEYITVLYAKPPRLLQYTSADEIPTSVMQWAIHHDQND